MSKKPDQIHLDPPVEGVRFTNIAVEVGHRVGATAHSDLTGVNCALNQCCETAPQFFMAYGLWRVMAFVFMAYGGESKIGEKAIIRIIRRNTARFLFLSKNPAKCGRFWRFFRKFSCF